MRKIRRLALFILLALSTFLIGVFITPTTPTLLHRKPSAWQVLLSFENQDLEGLDEQSKNVVRRAINALAPHNEADLTRRFEPSLFRTIANARGEQRYIFVEEGRPSFIPSNSTLRVCIFDKAGHVLNQQEFPTGWRAEITGIKVRHFDIINQQTLIIEGQYYFGGAPFHQYYALSGNQIVLIYHLSGFGFDPISYGASNFDIGPMIERSADEWEEALESSDTVENLSALIWLSGSHPDIDPREEDNEARKFLTVRARASVQKRLAELSESDNFWIKCAASSITKVP